MQEPGPRYSCQVPNDLAPLWRRYPSICSTPRCMQALALCCAVLCWATALCCAALVSCMHYCCTVCAAQLDDVIAIRGDPAKARTRPGQSRSASASGLHGRTSFTSLSSIPSGDLEGKVRQTFLHFASGLIQSATLRH